MILSKEDIKLYMKCYPALLFFVNKRKQIGDVAASDELMDLPIERKFVIRDSLLENIELIDEFVKLNPEKYSQQELDLVLSWKDFVAGRFYVFRQLKQHAIFLTTDNDPKAYGVLGLIHSCEELLPHMPLLVEAVLLPFNGKIVFDALFHAHSIFLEAASKAA